MITEDYVSFEVAKLLKEKGFDEPLNYGYNSDGIVCYSSPYNWNQTTGKYPHYSRPTLQMVMKWLREVHKIHCDIGYDDLDWFWNILNVSESVPVEERPMMIKNGFAGFKSYEEAAEAAIKYCLKYLI